MDVFKLDQSLSAGLGSAPAPDTLTPEVSFDAGSEFNLSFFDGPEENNSTQGFSDPGSVGSASASPPPGTPGGAVPPVAAATVAAAAAVAAATVAASASTGGVNNPNAPPLPIVQVPTTGIVIKQGLFHFFLMYRASDFSFPPRLISIPFSINYKFDFCRR